MPTESLTAVRGPFTGGYTSAVPAFMARPDQLIGATDDSDTNSSRDCVIDPFTGGVSKRSGCSVVGDTLSAGFSVSGILNSTKGFKARKFLALDSPSMTDAYPVPAVLYGEDINAGFPAADSGYPGTIYARSSNGADHNYSLLEEFGTTHYKAAPLGSHTSASYNLKVVPVWYESGDGVYNRGALTGIAGTDKFMQQFLCGGARAVLNTQSWLYSPGLRHNPWRWNKRLNESDSTGGEVVRIYPTGPYPPLFPPRYNSDATPSANNSSWVDGDTFFLSCIYQFEDGSYSAPVIPRMPNATLTGGYGLVTVGTIGGANKYQFLTYRNVPIGPEGTVARVLLRTPKQNRTAAGDTITVSPLDLRVIGVLRNNTQTVYQDYGGDDDSILEDDDVVRLDLIAPRRARYIGTGDQRAVVTYTLPNTAAIILSNVNENGGGPANYDFNLPDTSNLLYGDADAFLVRITATQLELHKNLGAAPDYVEGGGGNDNAKAFLFSTYDTLGKLVDAINATVTTNNCEQWAAQLAPGVDDTLSTTSLTLTTMDIVTATNDTTTITSAALFGPVGVGMKVSGTGVTPGTYVVSKASASSITVSTATSGGAGAPTLTFYQETGDNAIVTGGTLGYMRCFGPNYPLLLCMKPSAFPNYDKPDKQSVYYTMASPGALSSGVSLAPNSFLAGNRSVPHSSPRQEMARIAMGIVDVEGAAVVAYTDGIYLFKNARGGNSGEDFDCRLYTINDGRGCISYLGLVSGNGWAQYPTTEGLIVTDKSGREFSISGDVFNPSDLTGDLAYEIKTSAASAASDSDYQYLSCAVVGSKLKTAFRNVSQNRARVIDYDFSPGIEANGIEELLNPETKRAYIWSPPALYNNDLGPPSFIGAMGCVRNASGRQDYITIDDNIGTADGRLELINISATTDNGQDVTGYAVVVPIMAADFHSITPQRIQADHKTTSGVCNIFLANDHVPTFSTPLGRTLNTDLLRTQVQRQVIPIDQGQRGKTDMLWMQWRSLATSVVNRFWRLVLQYGEAENEVGPNDLM